MDFKDSKISLLSVVAIAVRGGMLPRFLLLERGGDYEVSNFGENYLAWKLGVA